MKLSDLSFNTIRGSVDIVDVVSQYLNLKISGNNFKGLCPFHNEKTPSFVVSPQKRIFHCFGCGVGGDVIKFVSEIEGLSYYEAALKLAKDYNIPIDFKVESGINTLLEIMDFSARIFHDNLKNNFKNRDIKNFLEKRKINEEIIDKFYLGYAPDSYNFILNRLKKERIDLSLCEELGIIKRKNDYYDAFRNRIIFPIKNISGDVIAFGGRILDDSLPKYLNSPESRIYHKRKNLYGLFENRDYIRKDNEIIIVEGYMDLIALWSYGIKNCVATLGTAFTSEQLNLVKRFVKKIIFLYDGDKAGIKAAVKGAVIAVNDDFNPKLIYLPEGYDPDDYIRKEGTEAFLKLKKDAFDIVNFLKNVIFQKIDLKNFENKIRLIERLKNIYMDIDNPVYREHFIKGISEILDIGYADIKKYFSKYVYGAGFKEKISERIRNRKRSIEENIASILLNNTDLAEQVDTKYFTDENIIRLIDFLCKEKDFNAIASSDEFDEDFKKFVRELAMNEFSFGDDNEKKKIFNDYYNRLKVVNLKKKLQVLTGRIKEIERESDESQLLSLINEREDILNEIKKIKDEGGSLGNGAYQKKN